MPGDPTASGERPGTCAGDLRGRPGMAWDAQVKTAESPWWAWDFLGVGSARGTLSPRG